MGEAADIRRKNLQRSVSEAGSPVLEYYGKDAERH